MLAHGRALSTSEALKDWMNLLNIWNVNKNSLKQNRSAFKQESEIANKICEIFRYYATKRITKLDQERRI